jgi:hypothetical protein
MTRLGHVSTYSGSVRAGAAWGRIGGAKSSIGAFGGGFIFGFLVAGVCAKRGSYAH